MNVEETGLVPVPAEEVVPGTPEQPKVVPERIEISTEEKLFLAVTEKDFLQARVEIQAIESRLKELNEKAQKKSKEYIDKVEVLIKKYELTRESHIFDNLEYVFKRNPNQPGVVIQNPQTNG